MTEQTKHWVRDALLALSESLVPLPHETNEIDWKVCLSDKKERLAEHLIAFANNPNGGYLVFGVGDGDGHLEPISQEAVAEIANTLANLGRDAVEPPLSIDHAVVEYQGTPILLVRIPEQRSKPAHRRGKSIEEAWVRSGGTTRKASRQEVGALMLNGPAPRWEEQRASALLSLDVAAASLDLEAIAKLLQRPLPSESDTLAQWLVEEGILTPDGRGYYITNFGAVAAARKLEQFPTLERKRIRVVRYRGMNKVDTIDELVGQHGKRFPRHPVCATKIF